MRFLVTADVHHNKPRGRPAAVQLAADMLAAGGDALLLVGDLAVADAGMLERALAIFDDFPGPRLFVAGNHDLWTKRDVTADLLMTDELPTRLRAAGWHWLEGEPFVAGEVAIVGNLGWYDYSYAVPALNIDEKFYAAKASPGAVLHGRRPEGLIEAAETAPEPGRSLLARWNDGKFVRLDSDAAFLERRLTVLRQDLWQVSDKSKVIAAVHHVPDRRLLPPRHMPQLDFARAYLGSDRIGDVLREVPNLHHVYCGHSHFSAAFVEDRASWVNIGTGYRDKRFITLDVP